jgi:hypothetical protein
MNRLNALERQANKLTQLVRHYVKEGDLKTARNVKNHVNATAHLASLIAQQVARNTKNERTAIAAGRKAAKVQAHVTKARHYVSGAIVPKGRFNVKTNKAPWLRN